MTLYLDNAATSFPKPPSVYEAVRHALTEVGASPGRASHRHARLASSMVEAARGKVASFLGIGDADRVIFTKNATESINIVLKGWLKRGDRVLISAMEHNSVVRPLKRLSEIGVSTEIVPCSRSGAIDVDELRRRLESRPRLMAMTHASNVNGALLPAEAVAKMCSEFGVPLLLDAAQTAGVQAIRADKWRLAMLACSAHKGLLGPPGVGVLFIRSGLDVEPLLEGGTGSRSEDAIQPEICPDRYESGTPNLPGIAGLAAGIDHILSSGLETIRDHELGLAVRFEEQLRAIPGITVISPEVRGTATVSFTMAGINPADAGHLLDEGYDIAVRTGLHCAPLAHRTFGTFPEGTVRVSPGYATTAADMDRLAGAIRGLALLRRR
ncbi:MAG TPA: cysteine desulfurase [Syntrophobacter fumaroxidans]|nr:cysteine desulfurase [Syntrophobacter fumaroxidans]